MSRNPPRVLNLPDMWRTEAAMLKQRMARAMFNQMLNERYERWRACADQLEEAILAGDWISVEETYPEDGETVLCYEPRKGNMFTSQFMAEMPGGKPGFVEEFYEKSPTIDGCPGGWGHWPFITHWQPLPNAPRAKA